MAGRGNLTTRTALLSLAGVAFFGFCLGMITTGNDHPDPPGGAAPAVNVDTPELQRLVLQSHRGLATNWGSFARTPRLVFFGYTFCPDICPMGLSNVAGAIDLLDAQGVELAPIFVTIDPARDTPDVLRDYVPAFHERLTGLTGKADRIRTLASAFLAYYEVSPSTLDDEYYLVDHTSYVYLINDTGALLGYYPESQSPADLAAVILKDLGSSQDG